MNAPSVRSMNIKGNHFILMNSMALEGDGQQGCFLCRPAEIAVKEISSEFFLIVIRISMMLKNHGMLYIVFFRFSEKFQCAKDFTSDCNNDNTIEQYSRPILLQVSIIHV